MVRGQTVRLQAESQGVPDRAWCSNESVEPLHQPWVANFQTSHCMEKNLYFFTANTCFPLFTAKYNRYISSAMNKESTICKVMDCMKTMSVSQLPIKYQPLYILFLQCYLYLWRIIGIMACILLFKLNKTIIQLYKLHMRAI